MIDEWIEILIQVIGLVVCAPLWILGWVILIVGMYQFHIIAFIVSIIFCFLITLLMILMVISTYRS